VEKIPPKGTLQINNQSSSSKTKSKETLTYSEETEKKTKFQGNSINQEENNIIINNNIINNNIVLRVNTTEKTRIKSSEISKSVHINNLQPQHSPMHKSQDGLTNSNVFRYNLHQEKHENNKEGNVKNNILTSAAISNNNTKGAKKAKIELYQAEDNHAQENYEEITQTFSKNQVLKNTNYNFFSNKELSKSELEELNHFNPYKNKDYVSNYNFSNNKIVNENGNKKKTLFKQSNVASKESSFGGSGLKLPVINSNRSGSGGGKINLDIKNLLNECGEYKEDPIIKKKLTNIMNDIVEINKVITTKTNNRIKVSSAPSQPFGDKQDTNDEKAFTFSKFPQLQAEKGLKLSKNAEIHINNFNSRKFVKPESIVSKEKAPIKIKNEQLNLDTNSQLIKYNPKSIKLN